MGAFWLLRPARDHGRLPGKTAGYVGSGFHYSVLLLSALVYGLVAIGGWLGDKVLGTKRVIMLGAIVLAIGYALVAWSGHDAAIVYMGMATIAVGNGLFKANPSSLLSTCYDKNDPRLDGAFTMYYMSINIGSSSLCWQPRGWPHVLAGA